ncbi:hypothetical protein V1478_003304 [Vespula squamosa]|uniref:Uncharacterized protein n=2 Tax=Vespula squamosa TaxID=30214 RepID=A0ABD2BSA9_VESSQ
MELWKIVGVDTRNNKNYLLKFVIGYTKAQKIATIMFANNLNDSEISFDVSENTIRIMIPKIETRICTDWISDSSIDRNGSRNRPMLSHFEEKSIYKAKTSWEMIIQTVRQLIR